MYLVLMLVTCVTERLSGAFLRRTCFFLHTGRTHISRGINLEFKAPRSTHSASEEWRLHGRLARVYDSWLQWSGWNSSSSGPLLVMSDACGICFLDFSTRCASGWLSHRRLAHLRPLHLPRLLRNHVSLSWVRFL